MDVHPLKKSPIGMKSLKKHLLEQYQMTESLFDKDIVQNSDIRLGELYNLSDISHYNGVTNDVRRVLAMFDEKLWKKETFPLKVSSYNNFINYWKKYDSRMDLFVNMLLNTPMMEINKLFEEPYQGSKQLANYLSKYFSYGGGKAKKIYICGRKFRGGDFIEITVYDDIMLSTPSSIKLTFEKK